MGEIRKGGGKGSKKEEKHTKHFSGCDILQQLFKTKKNQQKITIKQYVFNKFAAEQSANKDSCDVHDFPTHSRAANSNNYLRLKKKVFWCKLMEGGRGLNVK